MENFKYFLMAMLCLACLTSCEKAELLNNNIAPTELILDNKEDKAEADHHFKDEQDNVHLNIIKILIPESIDFEEGLLIFTDLATESTSTNESDPKTETEADVLASFSFSSENTTGTISSISQGTYNATVTLDNVEQEIQFIKHKKDRITIKLAD